VLIFEGAGKWLGDTQQPLSKRAYMLVSRAMRSVGMMNKGGVNNHHPQKQVYMLVFEGKGRWWWGKQLAVTAFENERAPRFSRGMGGAGDGRQWPPPSKTSICARFRGEWEVWGMIDSGHHPRKQAYTLVFKGKGRWWWSRQQVP
jgi:hypothetical protein